MSVTNTQVALPRASNHKANPCPPIQDEHWIEFVSEICRRLRTEEEIAIRHPLIASAFHFEGLFFAEMQRRARTCDLPFRFSGYHWRPDGEPAVIVFIRG